MSSQGVSVPVTSQSLMLPSSLAEASVLPSGLKTTDRTVAVCPLKTAICFPVGTPQSLMSHPPPPDASIAPFGLNDKQPAGEGMLAVLAPVVASQSLVVELPAPEANVLLSRLTATG